MATTRVRSMEEAVAVVRPVDQLAIPLGPGQPVAFLHALGERDDFERLDVFSALDVDLYPLLMKPQVHHVSGFFGPAERFLLDAGANIEFLPSDFRRFSPILERLHPRVFATLAAPPDRDGWLSLSLHAGATYHEIKRVAADPDRVLVVEVNLGAPRTHGWGDYDHRIHVDEADLIVESDRPIFTIADPEPTDLDRAIAAHVADFIEDGATIQTGIGGIPSTVVRLLGERDGGDYGIHSEMFTTGLMHLQRAGKVSNARKGVYDGVSICTFAAGTTDLYEWLDGNADVRFLPVEHVNAPEIISRNHRVVSVNGALAVDLWGQAAADHIGGRQFSGIGGHEDFVAASGIELEDRSLLCVPSTAVVHSERVSRIVAEFPPGTVVTTPRHQLDVVVTEFGVAELRGTTVRQRAVALAGIAHPDFRDELLDRAKELR